MPSPFPGMDPFIESQKWSDFHTRLITVLSERLVLSVRPKYIVDVEERVYVERDPNDPVSVILPDVTVAQSRTHSAGLTGSTVATLVPVECVIPMEEEFRESYLTLRRKDSLTIVTVIEVLSPRNKRPGADGFDKYYEKRMSVMRTTAHFVELDLLRGGRRMPITGNLPRADFRATVARYPSRPRAEVYGWSLEDPMPRIPIPLTSPDPDVYIDLQEILTTVYDRAGYDYSIDYDQPVDPPLDAARADWLKSFLAKK